MGPPDRICADCAEEGVAMPVSLRWCVRHDDATALDPHDPQVRLHLLAIDDRAYARAFGRWAMGGALASGVIAGSLVGALFAVAGYWPSRAEARLAFGLTIVASFFGAAWGRRHARLTFRRAFSRYTSRVEGQLEVTGAHPADDVSPVTRRWTSSRCARAAAGRGARRPRAECAPREISARAG